MSSQERAAVDHNQQFKWVPQGHTPSSFHKSRTQASNPFAMFDPGRAPAFWTPSPSPRASPRPPLVEPLLAPMDTNPPRRSGRIRQPVFRPDNVYGNRPPVDILADNNDDPFQGPSQGNQSPGPSNGGSGNNQPSAGPSASADLTKMVQDGGADLINFLIRAAVSSADAKGKIPKVSKVREWQYRDLMRLPKAVREEWKTACKEELEALCRHNVFKLTDLPKGCKTIGCRWVFNVKSDGCKKARLVALGFSQVEGIDFNELFSPVVRFESVRLIFALSAIENYSCVGVDVTTLNYYLIEACTRVRYWASYQ